MIPFHIQRFHRPSTTFVLLSTQSKSVARRMAGLSLISPAGSRFAFSRPFIEASTSARMQSARYLTSLSARPSANLEWRTKRTFSSTSLSWPTVSAQAANQAASRKSKENYRDGSISDAAKSSRSSDDTPRKPAKLPIVLCHGLFGFDKLGPNQIPTLQVHYWRGIASALRAHGHTVYVARVPAVGSIAERAEALDLFLKNNLRNQDVNLIGHSLGGLDGRFLVTHLMTGKDYSVRSLTTIATPHRGSPFMDWIRDLLGIGYAPELMTDEEINRYPRFNWLSAFDKPAFGNLTTEYMTQHFNPTTPNNSNVFYQSYGAHMDFARLHPLSMPSAIVRRQDGHNDGFVSVNSARWGDYVETLNADHFMLNKRASQKNAKSALSSILWNNRAVTSVRDTAQTVGSWATVTVQAVAPVLNQVSNVTTMAVGQFLPVNNNSWPFGSSAQPTSQQNHRSISEQWDESFFYGMEDYRDGKHLPDPQQQFDAVQFYLDVAERLRQHGL